MTRCSRAVRGAAARPPRRRSGRTRAAAARRRTAGGGAAAEGGRAAKVSSPPKVVEPPKVAPPPKVDQPPSSDDDAALGSDDGESYVLEATVAAAPMHAGGLPPPTDAPDADADDASPAAAWVVADGDGRRRGWRAERAGGGGAGGVPRARGGSGVVVGRRRQRRGGGRHALPEPTTSPGMSRTFRRTFRRNSSQFGAILRRPTRHLYRYKGVGQHGQRFTASYNGKYLGIFPTVTDAAICYARHVDALGVGGDPNPRVPERSSPLSRIGDLAGEAAAEVAAAVAGGGARAPTFACCDLCGKWRRVAVAPPSSARWTCAMNADGQYARCGARQELSNDEIDRLLGIEPQPSASSYSSGSGTTGGDDDTEAVHHNPLGVAEEAEGYRLYVSGVSATGYTESKLEPSGGYTARAGGRAGAAAPRDVLDGGRRGGGVRQTL